MQYEATVGLRSLQTRSRITYCVPCFYDWNSDEKKMLLGKAYAALPEGGALVVYEAMIDDNRDTNTFGMLMSLNMLIETPGGFDYTGADCQTWMTEVGFTKTRQEHLVGPDFMVVGLK